jgi:hypothetical protein
MNSAKALQTAGSSPSASAAGDAALSIINTAGTQNFTIAIFMAANYASCFRHATVDAAVCDLRRPRTSSARKNPRRASLVRTNEVLS